ncbi:hypothetical protein B0I37DRAFT_437748 [Chaetomium sp. MPI-CAGE-AT-0009]|nr:hypothetical protein B0I37DRAFT_437748 [Chaetomium sp. MPI-CAGE-AT-0009]
MNDSNKTKRSARNDGRDEPEAKRIKPTMLTNTDTVAPIDDSPPAIGPSSRTGPDIENLVGTKNELAAVIPEPKNEGIPLLCLPAELRLLIYAHLFKFNRPGISRRVALSEEVTHFLYSNNTFFLNVNDGFWLNRVGQRNSTLVRHIFIDCADRPELAAKQLASMLAIVWKRTSDNLRKLTVRNRSNCLERDFLPRQLLQTGEKRPWKLFPKLESIHIDCRTSRYAKTQERYERLCVEAGLNITADVELSRWRFSCLPYPPHVTVLALPPLCPCRRCGKRAGVAN